MGILLVYVTHPDSNCAQRIANEILDLRLAGCIAMFPSESIYWWEGEKKHEDEFITLFKTKSENASALEEAITKIHPYDIPCILKFEVDANAPYAAWIRMKTR